MNAPINADDALLGALLREFGDELREVMPPIRVVPLTVVRAEHAGWDCYVLVWSDGTKQQCSAETFHRHRDASIYGESAQENTDAG